MEEVIEREKKNSYTLLQDIGLMLDRRGTTYDILLWAGMKTVSSMTLHITVHVYGLMSVTGLAREEMKNPLSRTSPYPATNLQRLALSSFTVAWQVSTQTSSFSSSLLSYLLATLGGR